MRDERACGVGNLIQQLTEFLHKHLLLPLLQHSSQGPSNLPVAIKQLDRRMVRFLRAPRRHMTMFFFPLYLDCVSCTCDNVLRSSFPLWYGGDFGKPTTNAVHATVRALLNRPSLSPA